MILAIDPSVVSLGWAFFETPKELKDDEVLISQELYYCERHGQLETYNEMSAECADEATLYLRRNTIMLPIGNGEFQGGGHCTSLDPSWYTTVNDAQLITFGTVERDTKGLPHGERIVSIILGLEEATIRVDRASTVVIEEPQLWGGYKSRASLHSGALLGLHLLVGALYWWAYTNFDKVYLIPVTEWKGQLPKRVTQKRMEKKYNVKFETDDESDAVGLADYFISTANDCPI